MYTESLPTNNHGSDDIYDDVASTENELEVSNTVLGLDIPLGSHYSIEEKCTIAHTVCQRPFCPGYAFIVFWMIICVSRFLNLE